MPIAVLYLKVVCFGNFISKKHSKGSLMLQNAVINEVIANSKKMIEIKVSKSRIINTFGEEKNGYF